MAVAPHHVRVRLLLLGRAGTGNVLPTTFCVLFVSLYFFFPFCPSHLCSCFPVPQYPFSPSGDNNDPPNRAYQVNPNQTNYFAESISRGCTPDNAYPYSYVTSPCGCRVVAQHALPHMSCRGSYTPHYAQHIDPETGKQTKMVVVPAAQVKADGVACLRPPLCFLFSPGCDVVCRCSLPSAHPFRP